MHYEIDSTNDNTELILIGDSLQRIYGFIGAVPDIIAKCEKYFKMDKITLRNNYRFRNNLDMLQLEKNIRLNAEDLINPRIIHNANIKFKLFENQFEEAKGIVNKINNLNNNSDKVAILARSRGANINTIIDALRSNNIDFFYGLYTDQDRAYLLFHKKCNEIFRNLLIESQPSHIHKKFLDYFFREVENEYSRNNDLINKSLLVLLNIFLEIITIDLRQLPNEDKIHFISETFNNNALKQYMEYVNEKIVITTIHAAKGLEWKYVFLPDMEQYVFPTYKGFCGDCNYKINTISGDSCLLQLNSISAKQKIVYLEELSVFYVAVTRAKEQVYFSASKKRLNSNGEEKNSKISCMLELKGIIK